MTAALEYLRNPNPAKLIRLNMETNDKEKRIKQLKIALKIEESELSGEKLNWQYKDLNIDDHCWTLAELNDDPVYCIHNNIDIRLNVSLSKKIVDVVIFRLSKSFAFVDFWEGMNYNIKDKLIDDLIKAVDKIINTKE